MSQRSTKDGRSPAEIANLNMVDAETQWFKGELALLNAEPLTGGTREKPILLRW